MSGTNRPFDSWDVLKLAGLGLMFIDHAGEFLYPDTLWLRAIGRGAAPIFLFLAGYASSYRFKWDILALGILLSLSDFLLSGYIRTQNILFAILACRLLFQWLEYKNKIIERPYEWYVGALIWIASTFIVDYGSIGFLFALCGYMQRRPEYYSPSLQRDFRLMTFAAYAVLSLLTFDFSGIDMIVMIATLAAIYNLVAGFRLHALNSAFSRPLKLVSYYSGYIYAFHLIALEWLTHIPF